MAKAFLSKVKFRICFWRLILTSPYENYEIGFCCLTTGSRMTFTHLEIQFSQYLSDLTYQAVIITFEIPCVPFSTIISL